MWLKRYEKQDCWKMKRSVGNLAEVPSLYSFFWAAADSGAEKIANMKEIRWTEVPEYIRQVLVILEIVSDLFSCILAKFWKSLANFENFWSFARCKSAKSCRSWKMEKKNQTSDSQNRAVRNAGCARMRLKLKQSENTIRACSNLSSDDMLDWMWNCVLRRWTVFFELSTEACFKNVDE